MINPWDLNQTKDSLSQALRASEVQTQNDFNNLFNYVCKFTSRNWSKVFLYDLCQIRLEKSTLIFLDRSNFAPIEQVQKLWQAYLIV